MVVVGTTDANEEQDDENVKNYPTSSHSDRPYRYLNIYGQTEPSEIYNPYELLSKRGAPTLRVGAPSILSVISASGYVREDGVADIPIRSLAS